MILGQEVSEFVTNRQQGKILFFQEENIQLREYIKDLEQQAKLNKEALKITLNHSQKQSKNESQSTFNYSLEEQQVFQYQQLVEKLNEENQRLLAAMQKLSKEKQESMTKQLLEAQIYEENLNFYKTTIADLEEKLLELKRILHDKEYSIQELERAKIIQNKYGQQVKTIDIISPNEQNLRLHEEIENIREVLQRSTSEGHALNEQNKILRQVNHNMKFQLIKIQKMLTNRQNYYVAKQFIYNEELFDFNFFEIEQLDTRYSKTENLAKSLSQSQQARSLNKNERLVYQEKQQRMEVMLRGFKELYEKEKQVNFQVVKKLDELQYMYDRVLIENESLISSIDIKEKTNGKVIKELKFCRKQYQNIMSMVTSRGKNQDKSISAKLDLAVQKQPEKNEKKQKQKFSSQQYNPAEVLVSDNFDYDGGELSPTNLQTQNSPKENQAQTKLMNEKKEIFQLLNQKENRFKEHAPLPLILDENESDEPSPKAQNFKLNPMTRPSQTALQTQQLENNECREFMMNLKQQLDEEYDVLIQNFKKKLLINRFNPKTKLRSYSDPLGYFSSVNPLPSKPLNIQPNLLTQKSKTKLSALQQNIEENSQKLRLHHRGMVTLPDVPNKLFQSDVSIITQNLKFNKLMKKAMVEPEASFISNGDVLNDI